MSSDNDNVIEQMEKNAIQDLEQKINSLTTGTDNSIEYIISPTIRDYVVKAFRNMGLDPLSDGINKIQITKDNATELLKNIKSARCETNPSSCAIMGGARKTKRRNNKRRNNKSKSRRVQKRKNNKSKRRKM